MNACEWSIFLNTLSIALASGKSADELAFLSLLFSQLSTSFALLASTPPGCQSAGQAASTGAQDASDAASANDLRIL